jgi:hypothetical protein
LLAKKIVFLLNLCLLASTHCYRGIAISGANADAASINSAWRRCAFQAIRAFANQDHVRTMKALQAVWRWIANAGALGRLLAFVIGVPLYIGVLRVITRFMDPDPDAADALLMGAIMGTSEAFFVLVPIGLVVYAVFRLAKWIGGKRRA